jgi:hypothetical protein
VGNDTHTDCSTKPKLKRGKMTRMSFLEEQKKKPIKTQNPKKHKKNLTEARKRKNIIEMVFCQNTVPSPANIPCPTEEETK